MYGWTMLTEFNCQSATCVKNAVVFNYIHVIATSYACHVCMQHCFVHFCYEMFAEVSLPEVLEKPHQSVLNFPKRSFGQKKSVHCSFQGKWFSIQLSSVGFTMMKHKVQFSVLSVFFHSGIPMCLCVSQLQNWQLYVLMQQLLWKYSQQHHKRFNRSLSFIIVSVWLFGELKCSEIQSQRVQFFKIFLGVS